MRQVMGIFIMLAMLLGALPALAQQDTTLQPGEARILFLPDSGATLSIQFTPTPGETAWFMLTGVAIIPEVWSLDGDPVPFGVRTETGGALVVEFIPETAGVYQLRIDPRTQGGYVRIEYSQQPPQVPTEIPTTFLADPMQIGFEENFDTNARGWWVGDTPNTTSRIENGLLTMEFAGAGTTLSGFTAVPGSTAANLLLQARVTIDGDTHDSTLGVLVRMVDGANFYLYQVAPTRGAWRFVALVESAWQPIIDWQADPRLLDVAGDHALGVWALGNVYLLLWDGSPLGHVTDDTHRGGGIGIYAEVAPDGLGAPILDWEALSVATEPTDVRWGLPVLPPAAQVSPQGVRALGADSLQDLATLLVGEWYWNNEADTQAMAMVFAPDGAFSQTVMNLQSDDPPTEQRGTWQVEDNSRLIIGISGLPQQIYAPLIDPGNRTLTIPELGNRTFVQVADG